MLKALIATTLLLLFGVYSLAFLQVPQNFKQSSIAVPAASDSSGSVLAESQPPADDDGNPGTVFEQQKRAKLGTEPAMKQSSMAEVSPYLLSFHLNSENLVLRGYVPSGKMQTEVSDLAAALFSQREVQDNLDIAAGAPAEFEGSAD